MSCSYVVFHIYHLIVEYVVALISIYFTESYGMCLICVVIGLGKHGHWVGLSGLPGLKESFTPSHKGQMDQEKSSLPSL